MSTELPAERVRRRLAEAAESPDEEGARGVARGADPDGPPSGEPDDDSGTSLSRWLPDTTGHRASSWMTAIRADPGRAGMVGLAVIGLIAIMATVFTLARDDGPRVVSANLPPVQPVSSAAGSAGPASAAVPTPEPTVVISVVGLVHTPGLVTLAPGARVADALEAAGGAVDGADLTGLNMARKVADGEQVVVGLAAPPGVPPALGSSITAPAGGVPSDAGAPPGADPAADGPLDLNAATVEQLDVLPGIGPVTATAIVAWRDANGRFASVDQLGEVDGIGPARLEKLRELVRV